ncbi:DUF421 domain-containing protein [Halalkalibacter urbisdiaboli]|uniref:DUF421 domain-containing protein n=1 Tax=Halalkalibacter urbisdiaboli TaxID=1960589 RepID=UPI000B454ACC|nr:DUF421 domain-containing protein [Halalkalibacter urbisdiaboli]
MNTNFLALTTELFVGFVALLFLTKMLGKNQITQLTPFDFISAIVLGELVGNAIYDKDIGLPYILYAVFLWGTLIYSVQKLTQKFRGIRPLLEGQPALVIAKGKIQYEILKKNKLDLNQLQHLLREKDIFSIREVEYGILETNGSVSVLKKKLYDTPNNQDLNIPPSNVALPIMLILDGEVIKEGLQFLNKNEDWLKEELIKRGIPGISAVLYAEWLEGQELEIQPYSS